MREPRGKDRRRIRRLRGGLAVPEDGRLEHAPVCSRLPRREAGGRARSAGRVLTRGTHKQRAGTRPWHQHPSGNCRRAVVGGPHGNQSLQERRRAGSAEASAVRLLFRQCLPCLEVNLNRVTARGRPHDPAYFPAVSASQTTPLCSASLPACPPSRPLTPRHAQQTEAPPA